MTALLCAIAVYILALEIQSRPLALAACGLQVWGMIVCWKAMARYQDRGAKARAAHARKRKKVPAHKG